MPAKLPSPLVAVTLNELLSGGTCEPISLTDFESFLTHKQHAVEYLRFVVWYRSYCSRFFSLPAGVRNLSPPVSAYEETDLDYKLPSPARLARFVSQASSATLTSYVGLHTIPSHSTTGSLLSSAERQPFRAECASIVQTFLVVNSSAKSMTLDVPSDLLDATLAHLTQTTHPSVFHPVYQQAYDLLQTSSLPFFLVEATPNINREKQLYWWLYGAFSFLLGWAITIGCLFLYRNKTAPVGSVSVRERAWRLWAVPLLSLGGMQMYSAYRGFCSEVWGRGSTQLRPWELVPPSNEFRSSKIEEPPTSQQDERHCKKAPALDAKSSSRLEHVAEDPDEVVQIDISSVHYDDLVSFDLNTDVSGPVSFPPPALSPTSKKQRPSPIITSGYRDHWCSPPLSSPSISNDSKIMEMSRTPTDVPTLTQSSAMGLPEQRNFYPPNQSFTSTPPELSTRARIFGPERVVVDPRVKAVHRRILRDMLIAGFIWSILWTVVILCLPWIR